MIIEKARINLDGGFYDIFLNLKEKPENNHPFEVTGVPSILFTSHKIEYYAIQRSFETKDDAKSFFEAVRLSFTPPRTPSNPIRTETTKSPISRGK